jgi:hypothetical protein
MNFMEMKAPVSDRMAVFSSRIVCEFSEELSPSSTHTEINLNRLSPMSLVAMKILP